MMSSDPHMPAEEDGDAARTASAAKGGERPPIAELPPHMEPAIGEEALLAEDGGVFTVPGGGPGACPGAVEGGEGGSRRERADVLGNSAHSAETDGGGEDGEHLMKPLVPHPSPPSKILNARSRRNRAVPHGIETAPESGGPFGFRGNPCPRRNGASSSPAGGASSPSSVATVPARRFRSALLGPLRSLCDRNDYLRDFLSNVLRSTLTVMNFLARVLLWCSVIATIGAVVWYSRELKLNGTDPHLIAWFSAGAFVLLGFPISIYGIFMHLSNYYQPNIQCFVVRILWMVPIYSIESWLCLRFHRSAIYIETLRDCYESFVLYSFLQFLIEVLGGEEALIMTLKDKSPTRGHHIWGMQWCVKPWLMGQPVARITSYEELPTSPVDTVSAAGDSASGSVASTRTVKRVQWTSPFLVKCKYGVLQYVVLKFACSTVAMILEMFGLYKEGDFTYQGGYLYICFITNLSQCWALYCLVFFYNATKNELGPIRPVGKFLSVKALVFFTWWQSVGISILFQMGMIPNYMDKSDKHYMTPEEVAKGLQDYLICIEMFIGAVVHMFVFPHTDYLQPIGIATAGRRHGPQVGAAPGQHVGQYSKRIGRKGRHRNAALSHQIQRGDDRSVCSKTSSVNTAPTSGGGLGELDIETGGFGSPRKGGNKNEDGGPVPAETTHDELEIPDLGFDEGILEEGEAEGGEEDEINGLPLDAPLPKPQPAGFVRAFLDSTIPRDVIDHSVGIVKGDFNVERKTLLHHAATSDEYDLFSSKRRKKVGRGRPVAAGGAGTGTGESNAPGTKVGNVPPVGGHVTGVPTTKCAKEQD